ncbi:MAG TPA: VOC family protein [Candidatus Saccharimonas sp.]|nr:VOC family protein [Candidatus Saccharimonas sp.]
MKPLFKKADAIVMRVPSLEDGLAFYRDKLGHQLLWQHNTMAALAMSDSDTQIVLATELDKETDILVESVDEAVAQIKSAGGSVLVEPEDIPVGRVAVVADPFGNQLTLIDLTKGHYQADASGRIIAINKNK